MCETQGATNSNTLEWTLMGLLHEILYKLTIHKIGLDSSNDSFSIDKYVLYPDREVEQGQGFTYNLQNFTINVKDELDYELQVMPQNQNKQNTKDTFPLPNLIIAQQLQEFLKGHGIQHSGEYIQEKNCMEMDPVNVGVKDLNHSTFSNEGINTMGMVTNATKYYHFCIANTCNNCVDFFEKFENAYKNSITNNSAYDASYHLVFE